MNEQLNEGVSKQVSSSLASGDCPASFVDINKLLYL